LLGLYNTPLGLFKYVIEPKGILIYLNKGITFALSNFGHKQYPSNSLDQNNSIHGVYKILYEGIIFFFRFELLIFRGKEIFFALGAKL
jgi:hypothetical protein